MYLAEGRKGISIETAHRTVGGGAASLTAAVVVADDKVREELRGALARLSVRMVLEQPAAVEWSAFMGRLRRLSPDLLLIDAPQFQDPFVGAAHEIKSVSGAPAVIAVVADANAEAALGAIRAGANECILPPLGSSLREAVERVCRRREAPEPEQLQPGKAIGFLSAKGGCGATTLACHVATALRQVTEHDVLAADFDLEVGLLGYLMKAQTPYSLLDAIERQSAPDFHSWGELVWQAQSRLDVLPAPGKPPSDEPPEAPQFRVALKSMQSQYGWVVADLGRGLSSPLQALVEDLDRIFLVLTPDVPALYQAKQVVQSLARRGCDLQRVALILNRVSKDCPFTRKEIQELLGLRVSWELAELAEVEQAFGQGKLVGAESRSGKQLTAFAAWIAGVKPVEVESKLSILGLTRLLPASPG